MTEKRQKANWHDALMASVVATFVDAMRGYSTDMEFLRSILAEQAAAAARERDRLRKCEQRRIAARMRVVTLERRVCPQCLQVFLVQEYSVGAPQVYCSDRCSMRVRNWRMRRVARLESSCATATA
jgi:hypothetical protein